MDSVDSNSFDESQSLPHIIVGQITGERVFIWGFNIDVRTPP